VLTGGEPMTRFNDLLELLKSGDRATEWCVFTSGYRLTAQKARQLKSVGAVSVSVSLDHFDREAHNSFRGHSQAYDYAISALINCREAGLLTAISLCFTRATANKAFIGRYMELARQLGVGFVQWLEPLPQGKYSGKDVLLSREQVALLEEEYLAYNHQPPYAAYPAVLYHGYHQRRVGCVWGGRLGIYIDSAGVVHSCPFCHSADYDVMDWLEHPVQQRGTVTGCRLFEHDEHELSLQA
jgi:MoaA/NifB/PqqE/SkfB family radical SAM enzyme